jgi:hypothetical protein
VTRANTTRESSGERIALFCFQGSEESGVVHGKNQICQNMGVVKRV